MVRWPDGPWKPLSAKMLMSIGWSSKGERTSETSRGSSNKMPFRDIGSFDLGIKPGKAKRPLQSSQERLRASRDHDLCPDSCQANLALNKISQHCAMFLGR